MKAKNGIGAVLLSMILGVVPLIVSAYHYQIGLKEYPWFSNSDTAYDFFLYWKGQLLILLCGCLALYMAVKLMLGKNDVLGPENRLDKKYMIPFSLYFVLALLSTVLSEHRDMALWGGYEQWEGMVIVAAYGIVLLFAYLLIVGEGEIHIVMWGMLAGVFVLALLSAEQYFGLDFFRTGNGQAVMRFMLKKYIKFTFNFEVGRVYSTLYNPNYVGSYVALVLPVILSFISFRRRATDILRSAIAILTGGSLVIMLFGSESVTGCIGVFATLLLFGAFFVAYNKKHPLRIAVTAGVCVAAVAAVVWLNQPVFEYGVGKILHPAQNNFLISGMESRDGFLFINTAAGDQIKLKVAAPGRYAEEEGYEYEAEDGAGNPVEMYRDGDSWKMKFQDARFAGIELRETTVTAEGEGLDAFAVETPSVGKTYTVVFFRESYNGMGISQMVYRMYNPFDKIDRLRHIKTIGFEDNQHFGSRRGYIWSRTFPLLRHHILLGSGPNTFVYEFPNDDYVGMKNVGYDGSIVTKPHNMFMQIWAQTGFLSLLAFLALYGIYFAESMKLYFMKLFVRETAYRRSEIVGIGILLGTFGYLVTGLANDSTVAVAPLYWCLLGMGMAVNRYHRNGAAMTGGNERETKENTFDGD